MADQKLITITTDDRQVRIVPLGPQTGLRELRSALLEVSIWLAANVDAHAVVCAAVGRLRADRIHKEIDDAVRVINETLHSRLHTTVIERALEDPRERLPPWVGTNQLLAAIQSGMRAQHSPSRPAFPEVLMVLVQDLLGGEPVRTRNKLGDITGLRYPAIARALDEMGDLVDDGYRTLRLRDFPREAWERLFATRGTWRRQQAYCVGTGTPFKPDRLLRNLQEAKPTGLAVGGVVGARAYLPIDLIGTSRLDISMHAPVGMMDISWIAQVAPELRQCRKGEAAHLVVHAVRRADPLFHQTSNGPVADRAEILLDLQDLRLDAQAATFLHESMKNRPAIPEPANDR